MTDRFALLVVLASCALPFTAARAEDVARWVRTEGTGKVSVKPDVAKAWVGVDTIAETPTSALHANSDAMAKALNALQESGVTAEDIATGYVSLSSVADEYRRGTTQGSGYRARNSVSLTIRSLEKVGAVLDRVVAAGANDLGGVRFAVASPEAAKNAAMKKALEDARRRAELYAAAGGLKLGRLMQIDESRPDSGGYYGTQEEISVPGGGGIPIAPGSVDFSASVIATWEVQP